MELGPARQPRHCRGNGGGVWDNGLVTTAMAHKGIVAGLVGNVGTQFNHKANIDIGPYYRYLLGTYFLRDYVRAMSHKLTPPTKLTTRYPVICYCR